MALTEEEMKKKILEILGHINVNKVIDVEKDLSVEDRISLFFLLNDDPKKTLQVLMSGRPDVVSDWCRCLDAKDAGEWKLRLIESLILMQLFKTLQELGYKKRNLAEVGRILDCAIRSREFDVRKALYSALDNLTETQLGHFILEMDKCVIRRKPAELFKPRHIELYLLVWQIDGKIGLETESLDNVVSILDDMNLTTASKSLRTSIDKIDKPDSEDSSGEEPTDDLPPLRYYPIINPNQIGLCIILNQNKYIPSSNHAERRGSEKDCKKIKYTMRIMNIVCVELNDLPAVQMFPAIKQAVRSNFNRDVHSVLIVIVMAHGDRHNVYGIDGGAINFDTIRETLSSAELPCLQNKPKILILQCCRGDYHLDASRIESDGPCDKPKVKSGLNHYIICYSTIPDFKAYRLPDEGSPYIQQLCRHMVLMYKEHDFQHIHRIVTEEFYKNCNKLNLNGHLVTSIPEVNMSLPKLLYLHPPGRNLQ